MTTSATARPHSSCVTQSRALQRGTAKGRSISSLLPADQWLPFQHGKAARPSCHWPAWRATIKFRSRPSPVLCCHPLTIPHCAVFTFGAQAQRGPLACASSSDCGAGGGTSGFAAVAGRRRPRATPSKTASASPCDNFRCTFGRTAALRASLSAPSARRTLHRAIACARSPADTCSTQTVSTAGARTISYTRWPKLSWSRVAWSHVDTWLLHKRGRLRGRRRIVTVTRSCQAASVGQSIQH